MRKHRIAMVCPYFGTLPWYFNLFLKSCEWNPEVDFFFISDTTFIADLPKNVKLIQTTLPEIVERLRSKLLLSIDFEDPYKLCDFKPTYGYVFSDLLPQELYSFWGYCDIDVVFGKIANFITDELLNLYDLISVRHEYTAGFFMLYKNDERINTLFKQSADYKRVFESHKNFCFDECSYHHRDLINGKPIEEVKNHVDAMTFVVNSNLVNGKIKALFELFSLEGSFRNVTWSNGVLTCNGKYEALLYHLITIKNKPQFNKYWCNVVPESFTILPSSLQFNENANSFMEVTLPRLNKEKYLFDKEVQVVFGPYPKSTSGRFRTCGVKS